MKLTNVLLIAVSIFFLGLIIGCKKSTDLQPSPPNPTMITTKPVTNIGSTSVVSGVELANATGITDMGIVWGTDSTDLTILSPNKITNGIGQSSFADTVQNLQANTIYYLRAYATYNTGVSYGATIKFTTLSPQPTVYIGGYNGLSALYWKNGTAVPLPITVTLGAWVHSVFVVGKDVYAAGEEISAGGTIFAVYWKNGVAVPLTDTSGIVGFYAGYKAGRAYSIYVSGNDVYVAGSEYKGYYPVPKFWKNGVATSLAQGTGTNYGVLNSIYVVGNDVYTAGFINNDLFGYGIPTYWKNSTPFPLLDSTKSVGVAQSIFVKGNDVYVAGYEQPGVGISFAGVPVAKYWKNGVSVPLTNGTQDANACSIFVSDNDVYVSGWEYNGPFSLAKYWKNGTAFTLPSNASKDGIAYSIYVTGSDVHVAGYEISEADGHAIAKYWKNGVVIPLGISSVDSRANSIFVQ